MNDRPSNKLDNMPFMAHITDLRRVLVWAIAVIAGGTVLAWGFAESILSVLTRILPSGQAHVFSPAETFLIRLKVSAAAALVVGIPIILYQVWAFISPALFQHEKRRVLPVFLLSVFLFYAGTAFAYVVVIPFVMSYFYSLATESTVMTIGISQLFAVVARLAVAFGVVFQLPLIIFLLSAMGLVSPRWLLSSWRWALVIILLFSAIVTPPDIISQVIMTVPLFVLYLVSALVSILVERRKSAR